MGFLSQYSVTETLDLGDGFYVEVRKYLSSAQRAAAEKKLISAHMVVSQGDETGGNLVSDVDAAEFRLEMAAQAVTMWNLTDESDVVLPVTPIEALRLSIGRLPTFVVDKIVNSIDDSGKAPDAAAKSEEKSPTLVIDASSQEQPAWPTAAS
jgi:hypothetical protein